MNDEFYQIAQLNERRIELVNNLILDGLDWRGLEFDSAYFVKECVEEDGHLYNSDGFRLDNKGLIDDNYYCYQNYEHCGTLYYLTDEEGVVVAVPFG